MHLHYENVNDAFHGICRGFHTGDFGYTIQQLLNSGETFGRMHKPLLSHTPSRFGKVIVISEPVTITYYQPLQRVLFNQYRDCNPFFHLIEALWTLAGRDDIESLLWFNSKVGDFSDDGKTWFGAYGKRWRNAELKRIYPSDINIGGDSCWNEPDVRTFDQLQTAIDILRKDRTCRRVVLQQWQNYDLLQVAYNPICKDVPCNTEVIFLPRRVMTVMSGGKRVPVDIPVVKLPEYTEEVHADIEEYLDMTVINRSNDMLWGALGSNYVTFSFLLEYMALSAGYKPGVYNQFSNNLHVYVSPEQAGPNLENLKPTGKLLWSGKWDPAQLIAEPPVQFYPTEGQTRIFDNLTCFSKDLDYLFEYPGHLKGQHPRTLYLTDFFNLVVHPMLLAWSYYKAKDFNKALEIVANCVAPADWRVACEQWLLRRKEKHERAKPASTSQVS